MGDLYAGSSFISQPVQEALDLKSNLAGGNSLVGTQDVSGGNVNVATGYNFTINGVPIGGGGGGWVGTATSDLDMASYDIINIDKLEGGNNGVSDITLQSSIDASSNQIKNMAMLNPFLTAPSAGQVLTAVNSTAITWASPSGGTNYPSCFFRNQASSDEYGQQANSNTQNLFLNVIEGDFSRTDYTLISDQYDSRITIAEVGTYQVFYSISCYGTGNTIANFASTLYNPSLPPLNVLSLPITVATDTGSILSCQNYFTTRVPNEVFNLQARCLFPEGTSAYYGRRTVNLGNSLLYRFVEIILKRIS